MAHSNPAAIPARDPDRRSNLAAWTLFAVGALLLVIAMRAPVPEPGDRNLEAGTPTIEDWRGNSASIRPAE
jgi:hypothetical protein